MGEEFRRDHRGGGLIFFAQVPEDDPEIRKMVDTFREELDSYVTATYPGKAYGTMLPTVVPLWTVEDLIHRLGTHDATPEWAKKPKD